MDQFRAGASRGAALQNLEMRGSMSSVLRLAPRARRTWRHELNPLISSQSLTLSEGLEVDMKAEHSGAYDIDRRGCSGQSDAGLFLILFYE